MSCCGGKKDPILGISDTCCTSNTGCNDFDRRNLRDVKVEPIYVQKVYDAALVQSQAMIGGSSIHLEPKLDRGSRIVSVSDIRCRRYSNGEATLELDSCTTFNGAKEIGCPVIGPDGTASQQPIYVDTDACDEKCKGTPIYGTQNITIGGYVTVEIDAMVRKNCGNRCKVTLKGRVYVNPQACGNGHGGAPGKGDTGGTINSMNFFELCVPSTTGGAFLPRFTEFCNVNCEPRLITNSAERDIHVNPETGRVSANIFIALCISCEKKIVVPVQLCVLSTGFPQLSPADSSICSSYPSLFPNQTDPASVRECLDAKADEDDDCHRPSKPRCQGLSLSEDDSFEIEDLES